MDRETRLAKTRAYYAKNRERLLKYRREYVKKFPKRVADSHKKIYARDKEKILAQKREYYLVNKERIRAYKNTRKDAAKIVRKKRDRITLPLKRARERERTKSDPCFRMKKLLRLRLYGALKGQAKNGSAVRNLGCSLEDFKRHIESLWKEGMTWDNWTHKGWHIDHIVPLSSFDLTKEEQILKAVHYTNLQPLWWHENMSKGNKI